MQNDPLTWAGGDIGGGHPVYRATATGIGRSDGGYESRSPEAVPDRATGAHT